MDSLEASAETAAAPTTASERITALDTLRGFALLGILLMNIVAMGMYGSAYDNPTVTGGATGGNLAIWAVLHVLAEGKMRCLFSLVFGASIVLLTSRLEKRGDAADIYYRRNSWLLLIGILHAYLLWVGEILYPYALCALVLFPFRRMPAKRLLIVGSGVLVVTSLAYILKGFEDREMLEKGRAAQAAEKAGKTLTREQKDELDEYEKWRRFNQPTKEEIDRDKKDWQGNPVSVIKARAKIVGFFHGMPYYGPMNWDIWSMMLLGMGLFKLGVLSAQLPSRTYAKMAAWGYAIGVPITSFTAWFIIRSNFDPVIQSFSGVSYDLGRLTIALGHLSIIMLLCKSGKLNWLTSALGAVGQTALSNYVATSVITAFIFTGYGFKLYGELQRYQLYYVVAAIWMFNLIVSPIWLQHFRFGPMEWVWRSLTYWKRQPMRLRPPDTPTETVAATA